MTYSIHACIVETQCSRYDELIGYVASVQVMPCELVRQHAITEAVIYDVCAVTFGHNEFK